MARPPYRAVFFSSLAVLAFEVLLVRIFTIRFSYHYAALIISLSMFGLVLGGLAVFSGLIRKTKTGGPGLLPVALLALSLPLTYLVSSVMPFDYYRLLWENRQIIYHGASLLLFTMPFFFYGIFMASTLAHYKEKVTGIYATDLTGAGGGVAVALLCLNHISIEHAVVFLSAGLSTVLLTGKKKTGMTIAVSIISLSLCVPIVAGFAPLSMSPFKGFMQAITEDGARSITTINSEDSRLDIFQNPRMKYAPGLSLTFTGSVPVGLGVAIDGDISGTLLGEGTLHDYTFLEYMPASLPYIITKNPSSVLVCGLHTSIDTLMPRYYGARHIYTTETNRSMRTYIREYYHSADLFRSALQPLPTRRFLASAGNSFDVITLSRTPFFPSSAFGLHEDYELTVEAMNAYISSLSERGLLFIQLFILPPPRLDLRLFATITAALRHRGLLNYREHLIVYRSWETINFMVSRRPFPDSSLSEIGSFLDTMQYDLLYPAPEEGTRPNIIGTDYSGLFEKIAGDEGGKQFCSEYAFDIRPVTDDRPFFHYVMKPAKIRHIYEMTGKKWTFFLYEGMALPFLFLVIVTLVVVVFLILYLRQRTTLFRMSPSPSRFIMPYFMAIGFGFMFVEIYCIHRLLLPSGSPVLAFSVAIIALLICSGMGSMVTGFLKERALHRLTVCLPVVLAGYILFFPVMGTTFLMTMLIVPAGFLLGVFFPAGVRIMAGGDKQSVALGYTVNGAASIMAPPLASIIAVQYGGTVVLIVALCFYVTASALLRFARHRHKGNTA